jgi:putative ABC transport system permease protein
VLDYAYWQSQYGGQRSVLGQVMRIGTHDYTIIGVAPRGFRGIEQQPSVGFIPSVAAIAEDGNPRATTTYGWQWPSVIVRRAPGMSEAAATTILTTAYQRSYTRQLVEQTQMPPLGKAKPHVILGSTLRERGPRQSNDAKVAIWLIGVAAIVLIIACANVGNLLLARAFGRRREIAVRLALGASRYRLIRQMLLESSVLFVLGGTTGLALARVMTSGLIAWLPALPLPIDVALPLDLRALGFTLALSLVAALLSGAAPALHATGAEVVGGLKADGQGRSDPLRLRHAFVVGQVAFSIVLVVAAGLFGRALRRAATIDPGFDPHGLELAFLDLSLSGYTETTGPVFARQVLERVRALPGVQSATASAAIPLGMNRMGLGGLSRPGAPVPADRRGPPPPGWLQADWNVVDTDYFKTMKMPLVSGRDFTAADRRGAPFVVIVNETAARQMWPKQDPIGQVLVQHLDRRGAVDSSRSLTVIGVARDAKYASLGEPPTGFVYVPMQQQYLPRTAIVARAVDGRRLAAEIRSLLAAMNPNVPVVAAQSFEDYAALGLLPQRIAAAIAGSLGALGVLLAAIGIYGVTAYMVTSRTREIGIRMALGARQASVVGLVLRQGMTLTAIGAAIGLVLAAAASRLLGSLLFGVGAMDPITFIGAAVLFAAIGLSACFTPARRATRIEAIEALRYE